MMICFVDHPVTCKKGSSSTKRLKWRSDLSLLQPNRIPMWWIFRNLLPALRPHKINTHGSRRRAHHFFRTHQLFFNLNFVFVFLNLKKKNMNAVWVVEFLEFKDPDAFILGVKRRDGRHLFIYLFIYRTYLPWVTNYNKYSSLVPRYNKINIKLK